MEYIVTFIGYLNDLFRPVNLPKQVSDYVIVTANSPEELADKVARFFEHFRQMGGMMVRRNSHKPIDPKKIDVNRLLIPLGMFSFIESLVLPLSGEMPEINSDGEPVVPSGKKVWKN